MRLICNRTQNDAIWGLIALFLTNQIAGNTIDFKMNVIKIENVLRNKHLPRVWAAYVTVLFIICHRIGNKQESHSSQNV